MTISAHNTTFEALEQKAQASLRAGYRAVGFKQLEQGDVKTLFYTIERI